MARPVHNKPEYLQEFQIRSSKTGLGTPNAKLVFHRYLLRLKPLVRYIMLN